MIAYIKFILEVWHIEQELKMKFKDIDQQLRYVTMKAKIQEIEQTSNIIQLEYTIKMQLIEYLKQKIHIEENYGLEFYTSEQQTRYEKIIQKINQIKQTNDTVVTQKLKILE